MTMLLPASQLQTNSDKSVLTLLHSFDWRCLGFAFLIPFIEVFRRISFSLPTALTTDNEILPYACIGLIALGVICTSICFLISAFQGRPIRLTVKGIIGILFGVAAFICIFISLNSNALHFVFSSISYFLLGIILSALFISWIELYTRQNPLIVTVYVGISILIGNLSQFWLVSNVSSWNLAIVLLIFLLFSGLLFILATYSKKTYLSQQNKTIHEASNKDQSDFDKVTIRIIFRAAATPSAFGFILIFFSWGVMAIPPLTYANSHNAWVYLIGNTIALVIIIILTYSLRSTPYYSNIRQRVFFILPIFAILIAYFSFIRMLDATGFLKDILSIGFNISILGFVALYIGTTVMRLREKGLLVEYAVAPILIACIMVYVLGVCAYEWLGNNAMYLQIVFVTIYIICLSFISARKASLNDEVRIQRQCDTLTEQYGLSIREHEILIFLAEDYSNERIAESLSISVETVRTHKKHIYAKIGVHKHEDLMRAIRSRH